MTPRFNIVAVACICSAMTAGCSNDDSADKRPGQDAGSATMTQMAEPGTGNTSTVHVTADKTHAVQPNDVITLTISVDGFTLNAPLAGQHNMPAQGHYRVYLNDAGGDGFLAEGASSIIKVKVPADITDGSHEFRVVLVNNDNSPLDPPVEASVLLIVYRL